MRRNKLKKKKRRCKSNNLRQNRAGQAGLQELNVQFHVGAVSTDYLLTIHETKPDGKNWLVHNPCEMALTLSSRIEDDHPSVRGFF